MASTGSPPPIPRLALERKQRLQQALQDMAQGPPSREANALIQLRAWLRDGTEEEASRCLEALVRGGWVEEGEELLRQARGTSGPMPRVIRLGECLAPLAHEARVRRAARWQLDTRRTRLRIWFSKLAPALDFDEGAVAELLLHALRLEGFRLALDLGRRPRPLLGPAMALPAGVAGEEECIEAVLLPTPNTSLENLAAGLNARLPLGLRVLRWEECPEHASALLALAVSSHWRWMVPSGLRARVAERLLAFHRAQAWPWARRDGDRSANLDLKEIVQEAALADGWLRLRLLMGPYHALNPMKLVGAWFDLEPAGVEGMVRTGMDLADDPRLGQADRFTLQLKNMYEDAVLLGSGSNITLVDEDDDEPLRLG